MDGPAKAGVLRCQRHGWGGLHSPGGHSWGPNSWLGSTISQKAPTPSATRLRFELPAKGKVGTALQGHQQTPQHHDAEVEYPYPTPPPPHTPKLVSPRRCSNQETEVGIEGWGNTAPALGTHNSWNPHCTHTHFTDGHELRLRKGKSPH